MISSLFFSVNSFAEGEKKAPIDLQKSFEKIKADYQKNIQDTEEFVQRLDLIDAKQKEFSALDIKLDECISTNSKTIATLKENLKPLGEDTKKRRRQRY